jgi:hypothetical protein
MKIQLGEVKMGIVENQVVPETTELVPNKTNKYLLPCLKEYGDEFISKLNNVYKVAAGIGDIIVDVNGKKVYEKHIFILIKTDIATKFFIEFLEWVKDQEVYEDDYIFGNIQKSPFHMVVVKFPEKYYDSFENFKQGKYSQMFKTEDINTMFKHYPSTQKIFIKDQNYKIIFTRRVNKLFNLTGQHSLKPDDWEPNEYDLPPTSEGEIFNNHLKK